MRFAVLMQKQHMDNPWQNYRWLPLSIEADLGQFGGVSGNQIRGRFLKRDDVNETWVFTGFDFQFFSDEAEGYFLNSSAPEPAWFVMWRLEPEPSPFIAEDSKANAVHEEGLAIPNRIMLSYNEAARLIDGGETVDIVPLSNDLKQLLAAYVEQHYKPEPKKRQKPASFKGASRAAEG